MIRHGVIALAVLALGTAVRAAESGGYINFDVLYHSADDLDVEVSGAGAPVAGVFNLDPGFRIGIAPGFVLNRFLALELETGFVYNTIDGEGVEEFEAWYGHVPILLNVVVRHEFENGLTPFLGVGAGGTASIFDLSVTTASTSFDETNVKVTPAAQGIAGLRYRFNDRLALGVVYKYFATDSSNYDIRGAEFDFDPVRSHSVGLLLNFTY